MSERRKTAKKINISKETNQKARELDRDGYTIISELIDTDLLDNLFSESKLKEKARIKLFQKQDYSHKGFWIRLLDDETTNGAFDSENIFVKFATQKKVIEILSLHFKKTPQLMEVLLSYSRPTDNDLSYSQLWHRDFDDNNTVKLFVYLSDVNEVDDGPFTFLPKPNSKKIGFQLRSHLSDEKFFSKTSKDKIIQMCAPKLTVFMCETSKCYHMGSRVMPNSSRLMYTATFINPPHLFHREKCRFSTTKNLSTIEKQTLGLEA